MRTPFVLLKAIGKAVLNAFGGGVLGDILVDALPEIANNVWEDWGKEQSAAQRQAELEALAQSVGENLSGQIEEIVREIAPDASPESKQVVADYLKQVPAAVRRSFRRPEDPSGTTVPAHLALRKGEDLLPFLPTRLPMFKPGHRPLAGVDWVLEELLGAGGYGEVWKAVHSYKPDHFKPVALKFCIDPAARKRLTHHEAEVCAQVQREGKHPGIVALEQTYLSADPPFLQYEYIEGGDLAGLILQWHRSGSPPTPEKAARIVLKLAETVGYFQRLNPRVVHRDLKPANILTQRVNKGVILKIADFGIGGIALEQAVKVSRQGTSIGYRMATLVRGSCTPLYASPPQLNGGKPDPWDDVHALGVIWNQILTGNLGEGRPTCNRWWRQRYIDRGMSNALVDLLETCFEEDPSIHPADAAALAESLALALGRVPSPTPAPPSPATEPEPLAEAAKLLASAIASTFGNKSTSESAPPSSDAGPASSPSPPNQNEDDLSTSTTVRIIKRGDVIFARHEYINSLGMTMVRIEPGEFLMGSTKEQIDKSFEQGQRWWFDHEQPQHSVSITRPFHLSAHQVTVGQFRRFVEKTNYMTEAERNSEGSYNYISKSYVRDPAIHWRNPGFTQTDSHPVVCATHNDALAFVNWLNERESGKGYRLPTEAEWEYAARAGTRGFYGESDDPDDLDLVAWHSGKYGDGTHPVGQKQVNSFGLYDTLGNVWEWCDDWFDEVFYQSSPRADPHNTVELEHPINEARASCRAFRGGGWHAFHGECRPAHRGYCVPYHATNALGFRLAMDE